MRNSFASVMVAGGVSLPVIGALLGPKDVKTTARYAHLSTDPLKAAADRVGVFWYRSCGGQREANWPCLVAVSLHVINQMICGDHIPVFVGTLPSYLHQ